MNHVKVKKVLFVNTICNTEDACKQILAHRAEEFDGDLGVNVQISNYSPMFEIFVASIDLGLYKEVMGMIRGEYFFDKTHLLDLIVWDKVWEVEKQERQVSVLLEKNLQLYDEEVGEDGYLILMFLADMGYRYIHTVETIANLVSGCSMLKTHNYRLKGTVGNKTCISCDLSDVEDVNHLVL